MRFILIAMILFGFAGGATASPRVLDGNTTAKDQILLSLAGKTEIEIEHILGTPTIARAEGMGAMWTYQLPGCVGFVFFEAGVPGQDRRFVGATTGPRRRGDVVLPLEDCLGPMLGASLN